MTEQEYILATNLARVRDALAVLKNLIPMPRTAEYPFPLIAPIIEELSMIEHDLAASVQVKE